MCQQFAMLSAVRGNINMKVRRRKYIFRFGTTALVPLSGIAGYQSGAAADVRIPDVVFISAEAGLWQLPPR